MDADKIQSIVIHGKRWFDIHGGNTYFSGVGFVNDKPVVYIPFEYGYDDQYTWEVWRKLVDLLNLDVEQYRGNLIEAPHRYCARKDIDYYATVKDVKTRGGLRFRGLVLEELT